MSEFKTVKEVAEDIILSHTEDIEWLSIGEMIHCAMEDAELPEMNFEEFEEFQHAVDNMIARSVVEITFAD